MKMIKLAKRYFQLNLMEYLSDRLAFALQIISDLMSLGLRLLLFILIYSAGKGIGDWSIYEMIFLTSTITLFRAIAGTIFSTTSIAIPRMIYDGTFDIFVTKPINVIKHMLVRRINPWWLTDITYSVALIIFSLKKMAFHMTLRSAMIYLVFMALSQIFILGISLIIIGLSFKYRRMDKLNNLFLNMMTLTRYPISIFKRGIRFFISFVFPVALLGYYPSAYFFSRITDSVLLIKLTASAFLFALFGYLVFRNGFKHYSSAGG